MKLNFIFLEIQFVIDLNKKNVITKIVMKEKFL